MATLTAEALSTIETLFTDGTPAELIASVHLRSEPRYWFAKAVSRDDQESKVLEVVRHAPRPLILYATEVLRAREWAQLLHAQGYTRLGLFHGETGGIERQRLVDAWAAGEIDIMVATSAFGVGIDKRDVRCVLHPQGPVQPAARRSAWPKASPLLRCSQSSSQLLAAIGILRERTSGREEMFLNPPLIDLLQRD